MGDNQHEKRRRQTDSPRSSVSSSSKPTYSHRFVKFELSPEQKEQAKALIADGDLSASDLVHFDSVGYSWRSSSQNEGAGRLVTVTCSADGDPNNGYMLTGRGRDTVTAFLMCVYKDKYLTTDGVWASLERSSGADDVG